MDLTRSAPALAPRLLGCVLRVGEVAVRLTEVEAYAGARDPASHAFRGPTPRTRVMFGPAGHLYVYRSMGIHACVNIVCGADGEASACLLRAGEVVDGIELARLRRGDVPDIRLARGPGCLGQALGLTPADSGSPVALLPDARAGAPEGASLAPRPRRRYAVSRGPRVGVSRAPDVAWRFWLTGEPTVSAYARSPRAAPRGAVVG